MKVKSLSRVRLLATPWTAAYQAPLSMGFSRQEYWNGVPSPSPHLIPLASTSSFLKELTIISIKTIGEYVLHRLVGGLNKSLCGKCLVMSGR